MAANTTTPDPIRLQFFTTGTVRMRQAARSQPATRALLLRRLRMLTDRAWTGALPVGVVLIHHPAGPILFDTGQSPRCNEAGYLTGLNRAARLMTTFDIAPADHIAAQLRAAGVEPAALAAIVLSHLHHDHVGGLRDLAAAAPHVPVYLARNHFDAVRRGAVPACEPHQWPDGFAPRFLEWQDRAVGPFERSCCLTDDGKVVAVPTPGHVPGHVSLVVFGPGDGGEEDGTTYFLAGDATYGLDLLESEETDGVNDDPLTAVESVKKIKEFARQREVVVLPSHDADAQRLLEERVVYRPAAKDDTGKV